MISHRMLGKPEKNIEIPHEIQFTFLENPNGLPRKANETLQKQFESCHFFFLSDKYSLIKFNTHTHAHLTQPHMSLGKITIKKKYVLKKNFIEMGQPQWNPNQS